MTELEYSTPETDRFNIQISWSQIRSASECKQKAYLYRTTAKDPNQNIRVFFPGTVVDRVMRDWLNDENRQRGGMADMVESVIDREKKSAEESGDGIVVWKSSSDRKFVIDTCTEAATKLEPYLDELVLPYDFHPALYFKELPITMNFLDGTPRDIFLRGEMDILVNNPQDGKYAIWDLKITRDPNYWKKTIMQLAFYDLATYCLTGEYSSRAGLIQPLCPSPLIDFEIGNQVRREMLMRIQNYAINRWRGIITPKEDDAGCNWCSVRRNCSKMKNRTIMGGSLDDFAASL